MKKLLVALAAFLLACAAACTPGGIAATPADSAAAGEPVEAGIRVEKVEAIPQSFAMGADVSSLLSLEQSGVVYYGFDGQQQDPLKTLAEAGLNYVRVRVWVDPFDSAGNGYGGGNCTAETAAAIGARAAEYGMKLLVDFHYSDFWADPSKQQAPKTWADYTVEQKAEAITAYTAASLETIRDAGALIGMVQIGNETTNGFCGETTWPAVYQLIASGAAAVRAFDPSILIAVHYTNPEDGKYKNDAFLLDHYEVDYDVFASSFYPYWHGTLENLVSELKLVADTYGKKVMIAETAWAYTLLDSDGHANTIGEKPNYEKQYSFTVQGQANEISSVIRAVASLGDACVGVFYWEPAWIAVPAESLETRKALWETFGSGWASSFAAEYDPKDAGVYYGGCACDNQALFDETGHPLESLKTFAYVRTGTVCPVKVDEVAPVYLTVRRNNPISLPETVTATNNDGTTAEIPVVWESADLGKISASEIGTYTITGTADDFPVTCYIDLVEENYIDNSGFENADTSMWTVTPIASGIQTDFQNKKMDAHSGNLSLHFWNADAVEWKAEQVVDNLKPGSYRFTISAQGGDIGEGAELYLYAVSDGVTYTTPFTLNGWVSWQQPVIESIPCQSGSMTVGVYVKCAGGGWGTVDDFLLNPVTP
ncbi:MAG: glycosyl hydrolase 53 family protein [Clostridiaceae bacterium]